ncbi:MAG: adenylosuccinate synthase [Candidatus Marinimicrobia bacterium]|nr:adenylosuccinate synthase [Candidatus Neomarinimicrobiota bacterium]|tara:strand:+ start:53215 stop:54480 length:1266 start_codon:yes stop_codon:yes gene_type:complete
MSVDAIIGGQWGDEGKGKIVDLLSKNVQIVARYQGGANAGHTVYRNDQKVVLHQIPTGALRENCICILGNGMVIDPIGMLDEINILKQLDVAVEGRILIDYYAHIVTPIHKCIDRTNEKRTNNKIGTTCKGIGPTYTDKYNRIGIRAVDLLSYETLKEKIESRLDFAIQEHQIAMDELTDLKQEIIEFYAACKNISIYIQDTFKHLHDNEEMNILIEGAQGTMLDIDHGTYPYVTSSNCSSGGISVGLGLPGSRLNNIIGIFKAYTTRVGGGPFPTELFDKDGEILGKIGKEFGATTGRPRRCGWFDLVAARYSVAINGLTHIALTKLDILDSFDTIKVCTSYDLHGKKITNLTEALNNLEDIKPIYKELKGWKSEIREYSKFDQLPLSTKNYIEYLESELKVPISIISIGPKRHQIINRN